MTDGAATRVGVVIIGRNEGDRLRRCLISAAPHATRIMYVDSGSTDGSVEAARSLGADVVCLDSAAPFTAARARNAGLRRLAELEPSIEFVQFVDGDCELNPLWIANAVNAIEADSRCAVVCGRRREREPGASIYNRLCDMEWNTPVGPASACGGDALMRIAALREAGGYRDELIAGEEPELCLRLRTLGWGILRIAGEMTLHDAAMTSFVQWWRRTFRSGHAYAEGFALHGGAPHRYRRREVFSLVGWGVVLPLATLLLAWPTYGVSFAGFGMYAFPWLRVYGRQLRRGASSGDANLYAASCVLGKFALAAGACRYWWGRFRGRHSAIIEYKQPERSVHAM